MWTQDSTEEYERCLRWYAKKRKRELRSVLVNLGTYFTALQSGVNPLQIKYGFIHPEGRGVVAIAQSGGQSLAETRLYTYPETTECILYLLTIGDKASQQIDIHSSYDYVTQLSQRTQIQHERKTGDSDAADEANEREAI